jgi:hypothetical protein
MQRTARSESCNALIRVYDEAGDVIETHEHAGDFKEWWDFSLMRLGTVAIRVSDEDRSPVGSSAAIVLVQIPEFDVLGGTCGATRMAL